MQKAKRMSLSLQILTLPEGETLGRREAVVLSLPFVIGRDFDCDLSLPDASATLSRRHLQLEGAASAGYRATDLSTNGVVFNGTPMKPRTAQSITDGDILEFAGYRILISVTTRPQAHIDNSPHERQREVGSISVSPLAADAELVPQHESDADRPFGAEVAALEANLLFDPFEDGPGLRDTPLSQEQIERLSPTPVEDCAPLASHFGTMGPASGSGNQFLPLNQPPQVPQDPFSSATDREELSDAIDRAVLRFLSQFDPVELEKEYSDILGLFARSKRRFWTLFHKQFRRRRDNGEYGRIFRAILAEELRRK
jgi:type VI secretion system protein ImpI